jgi:hypothetical protein
MNNCCDHSGGFGYNDKGAAAASEKNQPNITAFSIGCPKPLKGELEPVPSSLAKPITVPLDSFGQHTANVKIKKVKTYAFPKNCPKADPEFNLREPFPSTVSNLTVGTVQIPKDHSAELTQMAASAKQIAEKANREHDLDIEDEFNAMYEDLRRLSSIAATRPLSPAENNTVATYRQRINDELNNRAPIPNGAPGPVEPDAPGSDASSVVSSQASSVVSSQNSGLRTPSSLGSAPVPASSHHSGSVGSVGSIHSMDSSSWSALSQSHSAPSRASSLGSRASSRASRASQGSIQYSNVDREMSDAMRDLGSRASGSRQASQTPYATPAPQYGKPSPHHHSNLLTLSSRNWGMPDFSPINYPNIANLLETPMRVNQAPEWVIGDEISQHGSERSVDSTQIYNAEQETLQELLLENYNYQQLRAISKKAGILHNHKGQTAGNVASRLAHNKTKPVVQAAILEAIRLSHLEVVDDTPRRRPITRHTKATPGHVQRPDNSKQARASAPNQLFK